MTLPPLTEKQFMAQVVEVAKAFGYRTYHPWLSMRSERGWPDLALFRPGRFLLAELKSDKGKLTPKQAAMLVDLREAGCEVHVWRPADWDELVMVLQNGGTSCTG